MKTKLFFYVAAIYCFFVANIFSQEEKYTKEDYIYKSSNGKSFNIKDAVYITEGLFNTQSTGFAMNVNGHKFFMTNIRSSGSSIVNGIKDKNGDIIKIPMNVFVSENTDMLFFKNLNIIEAIDVKFGSPDDDLIKEGDEVLIIGNHLGNGTIEERFSIIDGMGTSEISLKNFEMLLLFYENRINELDQEESDLTYKEMELINKNISYDSPELKDIKLKRINIQKTKKNIRNKIYECRILKRKYGYMFGFSSLGSPVIHIKSGKCIGFLNCSYNYKWSNIESGRMGKVNTEILENEFMKFSFSVLRFDNIRHFSNVKYSEIKEYYKSMLEAVSIYSYASLFLMKQKGKSGNLSDLQFPEMKYLEDFIWKKDFLSKIYQEEVKYARASYNKGNKTDVASRNAIVGYYTGLRSIVFGLRSRLRSSKAYVAFKKEADTLMRRMESLENDLDMIKRYN